MTARRTVVVGAVIVDAGTVLAARRTAPPDLAGFWEFPGGKVEDGEDLRQALVREVREELSATIAVGAEIADDGMAWPISESYELRLFLAGVVTGVLRPGPDHDAVLWLGPDDLESVDWLPSDQQALGSVRAILDPDRRGSLGGPHPAEAVDVNRSCPRRVSGMAVGSVMVPLGSALPTFALPDVTGTVVASEAFAGTPLLVAFLCNHCPYVKHVERRFGEVVAGHPDLRVVGVCTNDGAAYPDDAPARLAEQVARAGWTFPYLIDEDQHVGRAFSAACTPDFFLYDAAGRLAYRGAMDGSTPGNGVPVTGDLLDAAIRHVLAGEPVPEPHRPSMGCSIKWKH